MGSFGDTVTSLVDTYTRCLAVLKDFGRGKHPDESSSRLRRALRKARGGVRRVYSSKLSHGGSSFEKGDGASRGSLRRVIRRLTATLSNLYGSSSTANHHCRLDHGSLISLCDSSRADAIRTMTDLSSRLSTRSNPKRTSTGPARPQHSSRTHHKSHAWDRSRTSREGRDKRLSRNTMSTNSTKLGEIRHPGALHGQGSRVAYPRKQDSTPVKSKRRLGIF